MARRKRLSLQQLVDARWIDAPEIAAPVVDLRAATETDGLRASITYPDTDTLTRLALVAAGHGPAVLPRSVAPGPAISATGGGTLRAVNQIA